VITVAEVSAVISLAALGTAVYGIFERGNAAKRAERVRLTTIVENLAKARRELVELASKGVMAGDFVETLSAQIEILAQQALSLVQENQLTVTSSECREIAMALEQAGFIDNAEAMWLLAGENGSIEGEVQEFYANRGFGYFLFRAGRADEARQTLQKALAKHTHDNDRDRTTHASTLYSWLMGELNVQGPEAPIVAELARQIDELINACSTPGGREMTARWAVTITPKTVESAEKSTPHQDSPSRSAGQGRRGAHNKPPHRQ